MMYWHYLVMLMLIMILATVSSLLFPRVPLYILLIVSGLMGYIYSILAYLEAGMLFIIVMNLFVALVPILLIKYLQFLKRKADETEQQDI
ncbi:hypothetical protein [Lysinibacillus sp. LZ02]|uniref:hypothetical protein n=1 Tax=Lysinibacillus sp. LZ02 TaxID=3420668 RepID=UPI003D36922E